MAIKRISASFMVILVVALVFPQICSLTKAQTETVLKPTDKFEIPAYNSTISFSAKGTYSQASLVNGTWVFTNLVLNNSLSREKLNLTVSARDSNVTITSYIKSNSSFADSPAISVRLRYVVFGQGSQTFNLFLNPEQGTFGVVSDGVFLGLNNGWSLSSDSILTVTGERQNVTLYFYGAPETFAEFSSQPFYQQHSVIIATLIILVVTAVVAVVFKIRNKKQAENTDLGAQTSYRDDEPTGVTA